MENVFEIIGMTQLDGIVNNIITNSVTRKVSTEIPSPTHEINFCRKMIPLMKQQAYTFINNCFIRGIISYSDGITKLSKRINTIDDIVKFLDIIYYISGEISFNAMELNEKNSSSTCIYGILGDKNIRIWAGEMPDSM